jgi:hypothetical protein
MGAWVEFWAGGWAAADPTSLAQVGPAAEHLAVTVEVTRLG